MSTVRTCEKILFNTSKLIRRNLATVGEKKNIQKKKHLWESVELTEEQEQQIQSFYTTNYGKRIPTMWHRLYTSYTGVFHYDYFPEILLSIRLEPITNPYRDAEFLGDKNLLPVLFSNSRSGIRVPKTYVSSVKGILRNSEMCIIDRDKAICDVAKIPEYVIKKTKDTSSGRDVEIIHLSNADPKALFSEFGSDFVVQEIIHQSEDLAALNPTSLNTFRVITYICNDNIYSCPIALRIGRSNAEKDNIHYGGICVGVNEDGTLKKMAFSEYGDRFDRHPDTHIVFDNYMIHGADQAIRYKARILHSLVPWLGIISWDLTIDTEGNICIVEMNTTGQSAWVCQMVNGEPLFGDNTASMLKLIRSK